MQTRKRRGTLGFLFRARQGPSWPEEFFFHSVSVLNVSVHTTLKKIENAIITKQFGFVFKKTRAVKSYELSRPRRFRKAPFSKCFPPKQEQTGAFKFVRISVKLRFHDRLVWTVGLTVEINLCFQTYRV